jgi:hypothetical protein
MVERLDEAYELIEAGQLDQARALLDDISRENPNDPDVWWVYAHAVEDPTEAREALNKVQALDPTYPGAEDLIQQHEELAGSVPTSDSDDEGFLLEDDLDGLGDFDDNFNMEETETEKESGSAFRRLVIIGVIVILVAIGAFILLSSGGDEEDPDAEQVVDVPTTAPVATDDTPDQADPTEIGAVAQSAGSVSDVLMTANFDVEQTNVVETSLGITEISSICVGASTLRAILDDVIVTLQTSNVQLDPVFEAIAVEIRNCETGEILNSLGVPIADLNAYVDGELNPEEFTGLWRPVIPS